MLAPEYIGMAVPAWTGRRTWVGHHAWTPDYQRRREQADALFNGGLDPGQARMVAAIGPAYLLADCRNRVDLSAELGVPARRFGCATVYRRYAPAIACPHHGLRADRRAAPDQGDGARVHRQGDRRRARENARNHHFDVDLVRKIAAQGYLGAIVPQEYGGAGLDYLSYGLIVEEIGRGDSAIRTVISVQTSLVCSAILKWGTEEQKQHYLPKLCSGEWLGCFGLTEPDTGSDAANQKTRARRRPTAAG